MALDFAAARTQFWQARLLLDAARAANAAAIEVGNQVRAAHAELAQAGAWRQLAALDLESLREVSSATNLHLAPLRAAGIDTVAKVLTSSDADLDELPGLGPERIRGIRAAAQAVHDAAFAAQPIRLDANSRSPAADRLVQSLAQSLPLRDPARLLAAWLADRGAEIDRLLADAKPARGALRWLFAGRTARQRAAVACDQLAELLAATAAVDAANRTILRTSRPPRITQAWALFRQQGAEFYTELERLTGAGVSLGQLRGGLGAEIVARVDAQPLDTSLLKGTLRNYQHFGARYLLAQQRAILGDEMGLGKTFQAIATLAHLAAQGERHFVVVCPASVVVNWQREIASRSALLAHRVHGADRFFASESWRLDGGVAVTTFEQLPALDWTELQVGAVVVDEAHYIKNPRAKRSRRCAELLAASRRAILLTGTPLENRLSEFGVLVGYLRPELVQSLDATLLRVGPDAFRRRVAPVYLRRNQTDVLVELPERIETEEWIDLSPAEQRHYAATVETGNWMAMRQAAFAAGPRATKLGRLVELCDEAADNGRKVVVFSYFLGVLDSASQALGGRAVGPLTGSVSPDRRQELIDEFSQAPDDAVLLAQVQAGGVGLNIQAASVVVLCEPQLKPSTESQAIARVHRMGQVRVVDVHRLLAADSIDERIVELLADKQQLFDDYARDSVVAGASGTAVDPTQPSVAALVIEAERARLRAA